MKRILIFIMVGLIMLVSVGCGASAEENIVGTWLCMQGHHDSSDYVMFTNDGYMLMSIGNEIITEGYEFINNKLRIPKFDKRVVRKINNIISDYDFDYDIDTDLSNKILNEESASLDSIEELEDIAIEFCYYYNGDIFAFYDDAGSKAYIFEKVSDDITYNQNLLIWIDLYLRPAEISPLRGLSLNILPFGIKNYVTVII